MAKKEFSHRNNHHNPGRCGTSNEITARAEEATRRNLGALGVKLPRLAPSQTVNQNTSKPN